MKPISKFLAEHAPAESRLSRLLILYGHFAIIIISINQLRPQLKLSLKNSNVLGRLCADRQRPFLTASLAIQIVAKPCEQRRSNLNSYLD